MNAPQRALTDLYRHIDEQARQVHATYPFWPCRDRCDVLDGRNCCHHSLFPVSKTEWERVHPVLKAMPVAVRTQIYASARKIVKQLKMTRGTDFPSLFKTHHQELAPCPFLVNNRCSVYEARPIICRSFGYFADPPSSENPSGSYNWCTEVGRTVQTRGVTRVPSWSRLSERMVNVLSAPVRPLAAWIEESK